MPAPPDDDAFDADLATRDTVPIPSPRAETGEGRAPGGPAPGAGPPRRGTGRRPRRRAPLALAAIVASGWAALTSYCVLFVMVALGGLGSSLSLGQVARFSSAAWLLAQGVPLTTATDRVTL